MKNTRRSFLAGLGGAAAMAALGDAPSALAQPATSDRGLSDRIINAVQALPGTKAMQIFSPGPKAGDDLRINLNPDRALFCASAFKGFVLAEFLRLVEAGEASLSELLPVDDSIWSLGSPVLTPLPGTVNGQINARTALDAMISRSDNTATDMLLKRIGADRVRDFIASIGLHNSQIPNSTRQFFGYVAGFPQWEAITWEQLLETFQKDPYPTHPILNPVQTMAVSPHDFVSFYSRALQGEFFISADTLTTFRAILSLADAIPRAMPLGVNAFLKGGSIDFDGHHALSVAGGMFVPLHRWVYFAIIINWTDSEGGTVAQEEGKFGATLKQVFTLLRDTFQRDEFARNG